MKNIIKKIKRKLIRKLGGEQALMKYDFYLTHQYKPNIKDPKTYNEKSLVRRLEWKNPLFSQCSDKYLVRDYVTSKTGDSILIPLYFHGHIDEVTPALLKEITQQHGDVVLKSTRDSQSRSVFFVQADTPEAELEKIIQQAKSRAQERSKLAGKGSWVMGENKADAFNFVIEQQLKDPNSPDFLKDYKVFVFNQGVDKPPVMLMYLISDRNGSVINRAAFYDQDLDWMPISINRLSAKTRVIENIPHQQIFDLAAKIGTEFSFVRVDFYVIEGQIYFGELEFRPSAGVTVFESHLQDIWLGQQWQGDPRY